MKSLSSSRRKWRSALKKLQRQKKRQKTARERDKIAKEEESAKLSDPNYIKRLQEQDELEELARLAKERKRNEDEECWLRRELLSQREFRLAQQRLAEQIAAEEAERAKQLKKQEEREAAERKYYAEQERLAAKAKAEFEKMLQRMQIYLESSHIKRAPVELQRCIDSRPDQKSCEFFERTNCCRFGNQCQFNHKRPLLSAVVVVRHFFRRPLLEQITHREYAVGDDTLELAEHDMRAEYDEFFADVVSELEVFGKILNFRTVCNVLPHLSGHVFVEYIEERSALKAFINLQGRYYAGKRLNVEFSNLKTWRGAICGLSLSRKCPKGLNCNYLHLFRNPENKYNTLLECSKPVLQTSKRLTNTRTPDKRLSSWNDDETSDGNRKSRNWRWSVSPEFKSKYREHSETKDKKSNDGPRSNRGKNKEHRRSTSILLHKTNKSPKKSKERKNEKNKIEKSKERKH